MNKFKILIISSQPPNASAGLGLDVMESLITRGHEVDFLTKEKLKEHSSNIFSIVEHKPLSINQIIRKFIKKRLPFIKSVYWRLSLKKRGEFDIFDKKNENLIVHQNEYIPPVEPKLILEKIKKKYDFIIVVFLQGLLTSKSLLDIYLKSKVPILLLSVDMFPLTGGCYYFGECRRFLDSCGCCPEIGSVDEDDFTRKNFLLKKDIYDQADIVFLGNKWMTDYSKSSSILNKNRSQHIILPINEDFFFPINKKDAKKSIGINLNKEFVLLAGATSPQIERKGFKYLVDAVNLFVRGLPQVERSQIVLILLGHIKISMKEYFDIEVFQPGIISPDMLNTVYSAADVFICPSVDDAGPSMINQSIMSGNPVVSFKMGVSLDIVNEQTGYCAKLKDSEDLSKGIKMIYNLDEKERLSLRKKCRSYAIQYFSKSVFAQNIESVIMNHNLSKS